MREDNRRIIQPATPAPNQSESSRICFTGRCRVNVEWPGPVHGARIYRNELEPLLVGAGVKVLGLGGHPLGDVAFPLSSCMLVSFSDNGHLTKRKVQ